MRHLPRVFTNSLIIGLSLALITACSSVKSPEAPMEEATFRFGVAGDSTGSLDFVAKTSDTAIIRAAREQLNLSESERIVHIHGLIKRGNASHNLSWQWHFVPSEWTLAGISMELCDGSPSAVEGWFADAPDSVETFTFCPWGSYVKAEVQ